MPNTIRTAICIPKRNVRRRIAVGLKMMWEQPRAHRDAPLRNAKFCWGIGLFARMRTLERR